MWLVDIALVLGYVMFIVVVGLMAYYGIRHMQQTLRASFMSLYVFGAVAGVWVLLSLVLGSMIEGAVFLFYALLAALFAAIVYFEVIKALRRRVSQKR